MSPFLIISSDLPENCFLRQAQMIWPVAVLGAAAWLGLVTSAVALPGAPWSQAIIAAAGAGAIFVQLRRSLQKAQPLLLVIKADGSIVARRVTVSQNNSPSDAELPLTMRFAWRGRQSVRLLFATPTGCLWQWRLCRRDLNASQWRCLCRWILWLERGQTPV